MFIVLALSKNIMIAYHQLKTDSGKILQHLAKYLPLRIVMTMKKIAHEYHTLRFYMLQQVDQSIYILIIRFTGNGNTALSKMVRFAQVEISDEQGISFLPKKGFFLKKCKAVVMYF